MKRGCVFVGVLCTVVGILATGGCGRRPVTESDADRFVKKYDESAPVVTRGTVSAIGVAPGTMVTCITITADRGTETVFLAPEGVLNEKGLKLKVGDDVEVKGSRGTLGGQQGIIAAEVKKGGISYRLRDDRGQPV